MSGIERSVGPPWGAAADLDGQRQGVHRPVLARSGVGGLRPDLRVERDPAPADRAVLSPTRPGRWRGYTRRSARSSTPATNAASPPSLSCRTRRTRGWCTYNRERPHQGVGMCTPIQRFQLVAATTAGAVAELADDTPSPQPTASPLTDRPAGVSRWVDQALAGYRYRVGPVFAGEPVEAVCLDRLVQIRHTGVLVATTRNGSTTITPTGRCAEQVAAGPRRNRRAYRDPHRRRHRRGHLRRHRLPRRTRLGPSARRGAHRGWLSAIGRGREDHPCAPIRHDRATEHGAFTTPTDDPANPTPSPSSRNNPSASYRHQKRRPGTGT